MTRRQTAHEEEEEEEKKDERLPVDRHWLTKLLQRFHGSQQQPPLVLAPMVDQSDLPFRLLTRRYGCNLCFTPMIHARLFVTNAAYRHKFQLMNHALDRPLIVQLCGSDPDTVLQATQLLEPHCDGFDINCGCPQGIAKRGNYGAFLLEKEDTLLTLVRHLVPHLTVPLSVKVRLLPAAVSPRGEADVEASLQLYRKLVDAGVHMLTIHGRTRKHKGPLIAQADWAAIRRVVEELGDRIPILANGSVGNLQNVQDCLGATQADGVMSSEAILEFPALFATTDANHRTVGRLQLAREYMQLAKEYPPNIQGQASGHKCVRMHIHRMMHADLQENEHFRKLVIDAEHWQDLWDVLDEIEAHHQQTGHVVADERLSWYTRHRTAAADAEKKRQEYADKVAALEEEEQEFCNCFAQDNDGDY